MPDTAIALDFGPYTKLRFWLPMARIVECERACGDKSIVTIYEELSAGIGLTDTDDAVFRGVGPVRIKDVYEVIRCAAVGGGEGVMAGETVKVSATDATQLVAGYVDGRPLAETVPVAWAILHSAVMGVQLKKKADGETESESPSEKAAS